MRTLLLYTGILIIVLTACQRESRINIPYEGDKIVLNSFIQPDSLVYIRVTKSKEVRHNQLEFTELEHATVTLHENGTPLPAPEWKLINGYGYYVSGATAKQGMLYSISVDHAGLASVTARDSTPGQPVIKDANARKLSKHVRFTLQDNAGERNFYRIRLFNADTAGGKILPLKNDTVRFRLDPSFNNDFINVIGNSYYSEVVITDERMNGRQVEFVLQTSAAINSSYMLAEVSGLTEGAYRYLEAVYRQQSSIGGSGFFLDPVRIYSNVEAGYGIVAGINTTRAGFQVK